MDKVTLKIKDGLQPSDEMQYKEIATTRSEFRNRAVAEMKAIIMDSICQAQINLINEVCGVTHATENMKNQFLEQILNQ